MSITTGTGPAVTHNPPLSWPLKFELPTMGVLETAPRVARAYVVATLAEWGLSAEFEEDALYVASELMTNAVNASTTRSNGPELKPLYIDGRLAIARLLMYSDRTHLLMEVYDQAPGYPEPRAAGASAEAGRGLAIVHELTHGRWDWHQVEGGKVVRALLVARPPMLALSTPEPD